MERYIVTNKGTGKFSFVHERTGKNIGTGAGIYRVIETIAKDFPPSTIINFRNNGSTFDNWVSMSIENWLRATAFARGLKREEFDGEIEHFKRLHSVERWV